MSDDLIERLESECHRAWVSTDARLSEVLDQTITRIRELESANYRLTEERDKLKSSADKYHDEVLVLRARLKAAEADALERAARVLSRASDEIRALKPKQEPANER